MKPPNPYASPPMIPASGSAPNARLARRWVKYEARNACRTSWTE
jgi:hypothetical protein